MGFDYAGKVRAMLAKAESAEKLGSENEAAAYRAAATRIMRDYQIAEEEALAVDPTSAVPTHVVVDLTVTTWELASFFPMILRRIAQHTGVKVHVGYLNHGYRATIVGYEGDVRYTEFLWTSAYLMFSTRIAPVWDDSRSEADNIFFLRNAGIQRREIADRAWGSGAGLNAGYRSKVQRIYVAEAKRRGEEVRAAGLGFDTKTYREAYATSFVTTLTRRLRNARDAADAMGALPTLYGRTQRVQEAYDTLFPPAPVADVEPWKDPTKECVKCAKAKTTCNDHSYMRPRVWSQRDELARQRRENGVSARAGYASGRDAAEGVMIQRDHTNASRLDPSGTAIEG